MDQKTMQIKRVKEINESELIIAIRWSKKLTVKGECRRIKARENRNQKVMLEKEKLCMRENFDIERENGNWSWKQLHDWHGPEMAMNLGGKFNHSRLG